MWRRNVCPLCTTDQLTALIVGPSNGHYILPTDPFNEVYPNIFVGDAATALCTNVLRRLGITHVLNAALGTDRDWGYVNTNQNYYRPAGIKFLGIPAMDLVSFRLEEYFEEAAKFIQAAIDSNGKVLVHCRQGISRSSTLVLAYLMLRRGMTVQEAVKTVRKHREIIPNNGFLQQLCNLNDKLTRDRRVSAALSNQHLKGVGFGSAIVAAGCENNRHIKVQSC